MLDWFIQNEGPGSVVGSYFIDIYLDEILAERWSAGNLGSEFFFSIEGYAGLLDLFNLAPGTHTLKLVADPTNQIEEKTEVDNTYSTEFLWEGQLAPTPEPGERLPNLSLTVEAGGKNPMIVAPFAGASSSGGLSINGDTHVSFSILNDSPISIVQDFSVYMLFDDIVVHTINYGDILGGNTLDFDWEGLSSVMPITAGTHTMKLIADATGIVAESDESDNTYEIELVWGADTPLVKPVPLPIPDAPERSPQTLANLAGFVRYGWDAAISVRRAAENLPEGQDGSVWTSEATLVSYSVRNMSRVSTPGFGSFRVDVFVDDDEVGSMSFSAGFDSGAIWSGEIEIPANRFAPGQHLVKIVIDAGQAIAEFDETDNSIARWIEWLPGTPPVETPGGFVLSTEQIDELLAPMLEVAFIDQIRTVEASSLDATDWVPTIKAAGKAGYYLLTGRDLDAERIVPHFVPHDQFLAALFSSCMADYQLMIDFVYASKFTSCHDLSAIGFEKRIDGSNHVYIDLNESPVQTLNTYLHELGHALQDLENPALTAAPRTQNLRALAEAQAQIFEAAALRAIEEHTGIQLMNYPDIEPVRDSAVFILNNANNLAGSVDHSLGLKMLWMESLANTSGLGTNTELLNNKRLSSSTAKSLYDYLVALQPSEVNQWVADIFAVPAYADQFIAISMSRLEADLPKSSWSNPTLREPAFLVP